METKFEPEKELFERYLADPNKIIAYGFANKDNQYTYQKKITDKILIQITIQNNKVETKIIDLDFNEEANNIKVLSIQGEYMNTIREKYKALLLDIRDHCFYKQNFVTTQANQLVALIEQKYQVNPEFIFDDETIGVFRNQKKKWFGIIMYVPKNKISGDSTEKIEILNVKVKLENHTNYTNIYGITDAYHMSKKHWITICLDNTLTNDFIMQLIDESYELVKK